MHFITTKQFVTISMASLLTFPLDILAFWLSVLGVSHIIDVSVVKPPSNDH